VIRTKYTNKSRNAITVDLVAIVYLFVNIGLPTTMLPILKPFGKYFASGILIKKKPERLKLIHSGSFSSRYSMFLNYI